jgi:hypothetical protein
VIVSFPVAAGSDLFSQAAFPQEASGWAAATDALINAFDRAGLRPAPHVTSPVNRALSRLTCYEDGRSFNGNSRGGPVADARCLYRTAATAWDRENPGGCGGCEVRLRPSGFGATAFALACRAEAHASAKWRVSEGW